MRGKKKPFSAAALLACALTAGAARAELTGGAVKIGVMTDFSSVYADYVGDASVIAVELAIEDFGGKIGGKPIEIVKADFQNKPDLGMTIARKWVDEDGVDMIIDIPNSGIAIALSSFMAGKNKVMIPGAGTSELTGKFCQPTTAHFQIDTYALAAVAAQAVVKLGFKDWFIIAADYAMGHTQEADSTKFITANGGKVVGSVRHPLGASDMSSYVLQAQASGAKVLGLATAGNDATNVATTAVQFGVAPPMKLSSFNTILVAAYRSAKTLAGSYFAEIWYWDMNDETRAWAKRYNAKHPKKYYPSREQAALYSATLAYLNAVKKLNDDRDGRRIVATIRETPVNDLYVKNGKLREDGRLMADVYLAQVKPQEEVKMGWDIYTLLEKVPADAAFRPIAESECPLLKK